MTELFLHYIWEFQYFNKIDLQTSTGEHLTIVHPGYRNTHAGPDFFNGRVKIDGMEWIGNIEIHIQSLSWNEHKHDLDPAYDNVVLHVVWDENEKIYRNDGSQLPTLVLKNRIHEKLLLQYRKLVNNPDKIPCSAHFANVQMITKFSMIDKALMQRLEIRANTITGLLTRNQNDWEETTYQLLCRNFGFKVNNEPFEMLARSLPYKIILKHADQRHQVEALLFGQAGFLEEKDPDEYMKLLQREHNFLAEKYGLKEGQMKKSQWKFLRLRPANFPTVRIAQLAGLLSAQKNIFSKMLEASRYSDLLRLFSIATSEYWQTHYQFLKPMPIEIPSFGETSVANVMINTTVPLMVCYGKMRDDQYLVDRALAILQHVPAEDNVIVKTWANLGLRARNAADSQGLIELHNAFCMKRRCLDCTIGFSLLQPA